MSAVCSHIDRDKYNACAMNSMLHRKENMEGILIIIQMLLVTVYMHTG